LRDEKREKRKEKKEMRRSTASRDEKKHCFKR
jgi:hypothetical protein